MDTDVEQITVSAIGVWVDPVEIDEDLPQNEIDEQTRGDFFGLPIAALWDLGHDQYRPRSDEMTKAHLDRMGNASLFLRPTGWFKARAEE